MGKKDKDPAAVSLGSKGGKNSRKNMTAEEATKLAKKAAFARHGNKKKSE